MLVNITDDSVAQVVDDTGRVVAASANAEGAAPLTDEPTTGGLRIEQIVGPTTTRPSATGVWTSTGPTADGGRVRVYVGNSLESVREATASLRRALRVGVPLVWLLLVGGSWLLVGRALRRLDRIRAEVDTITESDLSRRVGASDRRRRGWPTGSHDEPDARTAGAGPASGSGGSSPTCRTTSAVR